MIETYPAPRPLRSRGFSIFSPANAFAVYQTAIVVDAGIDDDRRSYRSEQE